MGMTAGSPSNVQYAMSIIVLGSNVAAGMKVKAYNRNTKETLRGLLEESNGRYMTVIDGGNFTTPFEDGHKVEISLEGAGFVNISTIHEVTTATIRDGGVSIELTAAAESTSVSNVSL